MAKGTVFAPVGDDILALDAENGELRWRADPEKDSVGYWSPPRIYGGVTYLAGDERVRALDIETGEEEWAVDLEDPTGYLAPTLSRSRDALFVAAGETVYRLRGTDGEIEWSRRLFGQIRRTMALTTQFLIVATEGGEIYALSPEDGRGHWRTSLPDGIQCEPTATSQRVYVGCMDGRLYAIGQRGQIEWSTEIGDHPPVIAGDTVFTGGAKLRALKPDGGVGLKDIRIEPARYTTSPGDYVGGIAVADDRLYAFVTSETDGERRVEFVAFT